MIEPRRGYGRAMQGRHRGRAARREILLFLDGDGSDRPRFIPDLVRPIVRGEADFVHGTRCQATASRAACRRSSASPGPSPAFCCAGPTASRFTDMSPYRAIRRDALDRLGMREETFGWNLEMLMRVAAAGVRALEIPVGQRRRVGGVSKVSGDFRASLRAAVVIAATFIRLARDLKARAKRHPGERFGTEP